MSIPAASNPMAYPPVLLLSTNLARGGAETQVALLAIALKKRGWPVHVASLVEPTAFMDELHQAEVPVHSLGMHAGKPSLKALLPLVLRLQSIQPGIVHAHLFHANLLARCLRLLCPLPVVISTIHSLAESSQHSSRIAFRDWLYRLTDSYSNATVCVSEAVATRHRETRAISSSKLRIIGNAADVNRFRPDPDVRARARAMLGLGNEFTWLAAGRLMWKKDYPTLLRAMTLLPHAQLLIAGEGLQREECQRLAGELQVNVRFLGMREDVPALMQACDGFVLSSVVEGLPVVLVEAALSGLPCVATNVGGVSEILGPAASARLVPPGDVQALAAAMRGVMDLPEPSRHTLGQHAREDAIRRYSIDTITAQWEELYLDLLRHASKQLQP